MRFSVMVLAALMTVISTPAIAQEGVLFTDLLDIAGVPALVAVGLEAMAEVSAVKLLKDGDVLIIEFADGDHIHRHRHHVEGVARNVGVDAIVAKWK